MRTLALALPAVLLLLGSGWVEYDQYRQVGARIEQSARSSATDYAALIASRLKTQFTELQFMALALLGPQADPSHPDRDAVSKVQRFIALHPTLYAVNIQSPNGGSILWSTQHQSDRPITPVNRFTPVLNNPDFLLGQDQWAKRAGADVLTMRFRVRGPQGRTRYFVGSPYRLDHLLQLPIDSATNRPWSLLVRDLRDTSNLGVWSRGHILFQSSPKGVARFSVAVHGFPFSVQVRWPVGLVGRLYRQTAPLRWTFELGSFLLLGLAGRRIVILLDRQAVDAMTGLRLAHDAQEARQFSETLFDNIGAIAMVIDAAGHIVRMNAKAEQFIGRGIADVRDIPYFWERLIPEDERSSVRGIFDAMHNRTIPHEATNHWISRLGQRRLFYWVNSVMEGELGQPAYLVTVGTDITEQRRLAEQNARLLNFNQILVQVNQILALADNEQEVLQSICDLCIRIPPIRLAWIARPDDGGRLEVVASAGGTINYPGGVELSTDASTPQGNSPVARVWHEQLPLFNVPVHGEAVSDLLCDSKAQNEGIQSSAILPILHEGRILGELFLGASQDNVFDEELQELLIDLNRDVSRGLDLLAQRQRLQLLERAVTALSDGLSIADAAGLLTYVNPAFCAMTGYAAEEVQGRSCAFLQGVSSDSAVVGRIRRALAQGERFDGEILNYKRDGTSFWNQLHLDAVRDARGRISNFIGVQRDVTELVQQRSNYRDLQGLYRALVQEADVLLRADDEDSMLSETCVRLVEDTLFHATWIGKPGADGLFEIPAKAGEGAAWVEVAPIPLDHPRSLMAQAWRETRTVYHNDFFAYIGEGPAHIAALRHRWAAALATPIKRGGRPWAVLVMTAPECNVFHAASVELCERVSALLSLGLDALDHKNQLNTLQALESQRARTDILTGLPNRRALDEVLPSAIARADRQHSALALGMIDLDDFKPVNDTFGHAAGDVLLRQFAQRLRTQFRGVDFVARLGGDEFVMLLEFLDTDQTVDQLAIALQRFHAAVDAPFDLGEGRRVGVGMSMGVALYPQDAREPDALLRLADAALYQVKTRKRDRSQWWAMAVEATEQPAPTESLFDPFGAKAAELLESIEGAHLEAVANGFAAAFYDNLPQKPHLERLIQGLTSDQFARLRQSQVRHLQELLQPHQTLGSVEERARKVGCIHALVGLPLEDLERTYALYEDLLRQQLEAIPLFSRKRYDILRVAVARLRLDVQAQMAAMSNTVGVYFAVLRALTPENPHWIAAVSRAMEALAGLPGVCHAAVLRPDHHGILRVEALAGAEHERLARAIDSNRRYPNLNSQPGIEAGSISNAWFSREIQVVDACQYDPALMPWHELSGEFGWHSAAALPILNNQEVNSVVVLMGGYPHQFASDWARSWLELLRTRLEAIFVNPVRGESAPELACARVIRESLYGQGLRMWVQPIVDLSTGAIPKVEALARLQLTDGTLLTPREFLDELGTHDLNVLFRQGLAQALNLLHDWRDAGLEIDIAVNLAPSTLLHPDCPSWVQQALRQAQVAPQHLTLEILESEALDALRSGEAVYALKNLGVRLSLDDLGSGYSSLTRLADLPIDTVKIDQALVRKLSSDPLRTVRLLSALLNIGRDFAHSVIIEGLENDGLVEAAQWIGATLGQGYALAYPMPAHALLAWWHSRSDVPSIGGMQLRTWAGALAYHWETAKNAEKAPLHDHRNCPLTQFLHSRGISDSRVLHWHDVVHSDSEVEVRKAASDAMVQWLAEQVIVFAAARPSPSA